VLKEKLKALGRVPAPDEPVIADVGELNRSFASAVKRAGLGDRGFRIHDLRHTFVSWLGESAPHAVMQQLAGHVARSVTDRYAKHQTIDTMRRHLDALPALLKPASARAAEGKPASKAQAQGDSRRVDGASSAPRGRRVPGAAGSRPRRPSG
jgi:hypothetical protein